MAARPTVAADILLQALPGDAANTIESQLSYTALVPSSTYQTTLVTSKSISSVSTTSQVTSAAHSTLSTSQSAVYAASSAYVSVLASSATSTAAPPATTSNQNLSPGAIAGIAAGSVAAVVLVLLALLCFLGLRKRKGEGHARGASETSLLGSGGSIKGSIKRGMESLRGTNPKAYPEVAWLYDPQRPGSDEQPLRKGSQEEPRMAANDPWSSRPNTSSDRQQMSEVPLQAGQLPPIAVSRNMDTSFIGAEGENVNRNRSPHPYKTRQAPQEQAEEEEDAEKDMVSPLLPPAVRRLSSANQQRQYAYQQASPYRSHGAIVRKPHALPGSQAPQFDGRRANSPPVTLHTPTGPATYKPTRAI